MKDHRDKTIDALVHRCEKAEARVAELEAVALGKLDHLYQGECPSEHNWNTRDPHCPVCNLLPKP